MVALFCVLAYGALLEEVRDVTALDGAETLVEDAFTEEELGEEWSWLREDPGDWRIVPLEGEEDGRALEIRARPGDAHSVRNVLMRPVPDVGDDLLIIEVTVTRTAPFTEQYEQAGMTWYQGEDPDFKLVHELVDGETVIIPGFAPTDQDTVRIRLIVRGAGYTAQFRQAGEEAYQTVATGELALGPDNIISLMTYHGPEEGDHWMRFTDFRIVRAPAPGD